MKKPLVIIIIGPPGSGKGTQAELLAEKFNLHYLETSKIIEANVSDAGPGDFEKIRNKKYSLLKEKKLWETGILNTPEVVTLWIKNKIKKIFKEDEDLILAGSPRTLYEAKDVLPFLKKLYGSQNIKVILIKLSPEESIFRNSHRRICEIMRHPILYTKETIPLKKCPLDGSKLVRRKGLDDPKTIKIRLKEYKERTLPLIDYCKKENLGVKEIDGSLSPVEVFKSILKALRY